MTLQLRKPGPAKGQAEKDAPRRHTAFGTNVERGG